MPVFLWQVKQYRFFNNYAIVFQVISSIAIPLLSQLITCEGSSQLLLTLVSTHAAIVLGLEKAMRSQEKYRAYRGAESSALDYWRRLVHMPWTLRDGMSSEGLDFLDIIKEELTIFMRQSEEVRDFARKIETYAGNREAEGSKDNSNQQSRGRVPAEHDAVSSMGAGASSISRPPTSAEQPRPAPP